MQSMTGYAGGRGGSNSSFMQMQLKPLEVSRRQSADVVINRLRGRLAARPRRAACSWCRSRTSAWAGRASTRFLRLRADGQRQLAPAAHLDAARAARWPTLPELADVDTDVRGQGPPDRRWPSTAKLPPGWA